MNATTPEKQLDEEKKLAVPRDVLLIVFIHGCGLGDIHGMKHQAHDDFQL